MNPPKEHMVIGQFNESFPPLMDGVGNVVMNYTTNLRALGHEAYAVVAGSKEAKNYDLEHNINYTIRNKMHTLPKLEPYGIVTFERSFVRRLKEIPFDIVHAHAPFLQGRLAQFIAKKHKIPLVATFHTQFKDDIRGAVKPRWLADWFTNIILQHYYHADEVWTPSNWSKRKLEEYGFTGRIVVMENGCDMEIPPAEEVPGLVAAGRNLAKGGTDVPLLLYVGQHKTEKNLDMLLDALEILSKHTEFKMIFVGIGPDKARFESYVEAHGLGRQVAFLGRITDRSLLKGLFAASSLFVFPSVYDTSCLVMREAAAFDLPLLYIQGSCTSECILDGRNGFLAENTPEAYAAKIRWILEHPDARKAAGIGARTTLYQSWRDVSVNVEQRYRKVIAEH